MKTAVLVIDVQREMFDRKPPPFEGEEVIDRINTITSKARSIGAPVIFIQHESENGSIDYGSDPWKMPQRLQVENSDIKIRKTTPDSFLRTNLEETLKLLNITSVQLNNQILSIGYMHLILGFCNLI